MDIARVLLDAIDKKNTYSPFGSLIGIDSEQEMELRSIQPGTVDASHNTISVRKCIETGMYWFSRRTWDHPELLDWEQVVEYSRSPFVLRKSEDRKRYV